MRLIFDELLSVRVAKALAALGLRVEHVGGVGQPSKGSSDGEVLEHARRCHQYVVTNNMDMIVLCADECEPVIWLDARGKSWTRAETALVCFRTVDRWQELLESVDGPACLVVHKTTLKVIPLEDAKRLALGRNRVRKRRAARARQGVVPEPGPLFGAADPDPGT